MPDTVFRFWTAAFRTDGVFAQQRIQIIAPDEPTAWEKITARLIAEFDSAEVSVFREDLPNPGIMPPDDRHQWEQRQYAIQDERKEAERRKVQDRAKKAREHRQGIHNAAENAHRQLREEQRKRKLENAITY